LGQSVNIEKPLNPIESHRAVRSTFGVAHKNDGFVSYLGLRIAYHDLEDSNYGFLRGTQIEFMDMLFSKSKQETKVEKATIVSIVSLAQRSEFFKSFSWRMKLGWDNDSFSSDGEFGASVGAGYSWGNKEGFVYFLVDPLFYLAKEFNCGVGGSVGVSVDKYKFMNTNIEATKRVYDNGVNQLLIKASQGFRTSQNTQIILKYNYKDRYLNDAIKKEETFMGMMNYYF
jgi:hypothetical protein